MNAKHLASLVVVILTIVFIQVVLQVRKNLTAMQTEVQKARGEAEGIEIQLRTEKTVLAQLQKNSGALIAYLQEWEPQMKGIETPEAGELSVASRVKRSGIVSLAQRFEAVSTKTPTLPRVLRANMTVEDDYARTMNWIGDMEQGFPASRISRLRIERGQSGNDIRAEVVLDLPLLRTEAAAP